MVIGRHDTGAGGPYSIRCYLLYTLKTFWMVTDKGGPLRQIMGFRHLSFRKGPPIRPRGTSDRKCPSMMLQRRLSDLWAEHFDKLIDVRW